MQGDDVLMKGVLKAIREVCRSPSILLLYPLLYSQDTWDSVMETTKESFMLCPGVFIMYSILFSTPTPALAEMINRFRDQMVEGRPSNWCTPLSETLAGADLRVLLSDEFCTEGSSIPLFRGPPLFVKWATNRKEFENIVTHFNLFTLSAVLRNNDILFPPWVVELIDTMGEVRDTS